MILASSGDISHLDLKSLSGADRTIGMRWGEAMASSRSVDTGHNLTLSDDNLLDTAQAKGYALDRSRQPALSHARLWAAIDGLARRYGLTASALARKAGLNATTFNRSKRFGSDGRPRWPSMESIAKALEATGAPLAEFFALLSADVADALPPVRAVPITGSAHAGQPGFFDSGGHPAGPGWDLVAFPGARASAMFALEVIGDEFDPLYRAGDVIVVAPEAEVRRGDRVIVRHRDGSVAARVLRRDTLATLEFDGPESSTSVARHDIVWLGRVVWASQ
jgi:phage repressor protein C with HTH and peptisase S24 domain